MALWLNFEGLSGGGKSTAIATITKILESRNRSVAVLDIESGKYAPELLKVASQFDFNDHRRMQLFWILRRQQYEQVLEKDSAVDIIITDRFWGSSLAIDHFGNDVPLDVMAWFGAALTRDPDITFLFEVTLEEARKRKKSPTLENDAFVERVVQGYAQLASDGDWIEVDTTFSREEVAESCLRIILQRLQSVRV